jgi:hypothetical protein
MLSSRDNQLCEDVTMADELPKPFRMTAKDGVLGGSLLAAGVIVAVLTLNQTHNIVLAQGAPSSGSSDDIAPAKPGGTRPTTPAPEPARPETSTPEVAPGTTGSSAGETAPTSQDRPPELGKPLPPAPAEKAAPPMK